MRADAARNLDAVLRTGARLLADNPGTSMADIASAAGVDRRTVYRHFASRDALLGGVSRAKLAEIDEVLDQSRLDQAPVPVALHRFVEGVVAVIRRYPVGHEQLVCPGADCEHWLAQGARVEAFLRRAADEGFIRSDLPDGMASALFYDIVGLVSKQFRDLECGRAADLAVETLLNGIGRD